MRRLKVIGWVAVGAVLAGAVVYGAVLAMYRIAQALSLPPALTNLSPLVAIAAVWFFIARPVTRKLERQQAQRYRQSGTRIRGMNAQQRIPTKREMIWKIGMLYWGGLMFLFFAVVGPLIPHFTMGKPLNLHGFRSGLASSAIICFPGGAIFGWLLWRSAERTRKQSR